MEASSHIMTHLSVNSSLSKLEIYACTARLHLHKNRLLVTHNILFRRSGLQSNGKVLSLLQCCQGFKCLRALCKGDANRAKVVVEEGGAELCMRMLKSCRQYAKVVMVVLELTGDLIRTGGGKGAFRQAGGVEIVSEVLKLHISVARIQVSGLGVCACVNACPSRR